MAYTVNDHFITIFMAYFFLHNPEYRLPFPHPKSLSLSKLYMTQLRYFLNWMIYLKLHEAAYLKENLKEILDK